MYLGIAESDDVRYQIPIPRFISRRPIIELSRYWLLFPRRSLTTRVMTASFPASTPDWNNLQVLHRNTLPPRASFFNYTTSEKALAYDVSQSKTLSLNGRWKFLHSPSPFQAPEGFESPEFDSSKWDEITVPSMWQLQGHGNPQYLNSNYGIPVDQPNGKLMHGDSSGKIQVTLCSSTF